MSKQDLINALEARESVLIKRYNMYCREVNERGVQLSYNAAAVGRTNAKKELELCKLVSNLVDLLSEAQVKLITYDNMNTLYRITEPMERHRRQVLNGD